MKKMLLSIVLFINLVLIPIAVPRPVAAAIASGCNTSSAFLGLPPWYEYLDIGPKNGDSCAIIGPVDKENKIDWGLASGRIGLAIVDILLRIGGIVAVVFVLYGGIRLTMSGGEPDRFKQAKDTIINALVGLVVVLVATAAVNFIGNTLIK